MTAAALAVLNRQARDIFDLSFASHDQKDLTGLGEGDPIAETCLNFNLKVLRVSSLDWVENSDGCEKPSTAANSSETVCSQKENLYQNIRTLPIFSIFFFSLAPLFVVLTINVCCRRREET